MKKLVRPAILTLCLAALAHTASVPVQNMTQFSLGAEYFGTVHGHEALYRFDSSGMAAHFMRLHYSPAPFLRFSAGFGGSHSYASPMVKGSRMGGAVTGGVGLYIPELFDFLSITVGYDGYYVNADEAYNMNLMRTDSSIYVFRERSGKTNAALHVPYAGLIFHAGRFADIEIGGQYHNFTILKRTRTNYRPEGFDELTGILTQTVIRSEELKDETVDQVRIYGSITLHERESGAYLSSGLGYALTNQGDNGQSVLQNMSIWAQVGIIMRENRGPARGARYSESYVDLKWRQDRMAARLAQEPPRSRERGNNRAKTTAVAADDADSVTVSTGE